MPRSFLDRIYDGCAVLAALALMAIAVLVLLQAGARWMLIGVQGLSEWAGYMLAASSFLAFAHTLRRGGHIRVQIALQTTPPKVRHALELISHAIGTFLTGFLAYYAVNFVWTSYKFDEISQGSDGAPLWIPQSAMAVGAVMLFVAMAHSFIELLLGRTPPTVVESEVAVLTDTARESAGS